MIAAIDLTKRYEDGVLALDGLNLRVNPGEIYCLLGENGAGKTTAINIFLNFVEPTSGRALINGIDVSKRPLEAKGHLAYLPENVRLYGSLTARQNFDFFARLAGRGKLGGAEMRAAFRRVGLADRHQHQRVRTFSKGMRQKLGLALAIARQAPAVLLDEPTSGLDASAASDVVEIFRGMAAEGTALLISTHDVFRAKQMADRLGIMRGGRLLVELPREQLGEENLERLYLRYVARADRPGEPEGDGPLQG